MIKILDILAMVLIITWAIGIVGFNAGTGIHFLLVLALIAIIIRIIRGDKPFLGSYK